MIIQTETGTLTVAATVPGQVDDTASKQRDHILQAASRLIEYWKNKPNLGKLQADYQAELNILENVFFQILLLRLPDYAGTNALDVLGSIVGAERDGLANADFLVRIKARILANSSFGTGPNIIELIKLLTSETFRLQRTGTAQFSVSFRTRVSDPVMRQLPALIHDAKVAGVGDDIDFVTNSTKGMLYGTVYSGTLNQHRGYGSAYDLANGPLYGHAAT